MRNLSLIRLWVCVAFLNLGSSQSYAQALDTTIIAKMMLVSKYSIDKKPVAALSITLVNTSDKDIYIPEIFNRNRYPVGAKIKSYVKKNNIYIHNGNIGLSLPLRPRFGSFLSGIRNEIIDRYLNVGKEKAETQDSILNEFAKRNNTTVKREGRLEPLFLKAHEAYEINLVKDVDYLVNIAGEYKLIYELDLSLIDKGTYPEQIEGYRRFVPSKMTSNILYIKIEP